MGLFTLKNKYEGYEHRIMRWAFAIVMFLAFKDIKLFATQEYPIGIAQFVDLTFLSNPLIQNISYILFIAAIILFLLGRNFILSLSYLFIYSTITMTLYSSQGAVGHGTQIVSLVILAQLIAHVWHRYFIKDNQKLNVNDLCFYYTQQIIAAAYVVAGITKLMRSGLLYNIIPIWSVRVKFIPVEITKIHDQKFYGTFNANMMERGDLISQFLLDHQLLTQCMFSLGLFLELFAFFLLINRFSSILVGLSLIGLHVVIGLVMNLHFYYNIMVLFIFTLNVPWLINQSFKKFNKFKVS